MNCAAKFWGSWASRGLVIDEQAMTAALSAGDLFGAGLDVFDEEPTPPDNPLRVARGEPALWVVPELL
jgi:lactate dehydrogenase-like 2-hydroxyacid dehydrogenase